MRPIAVGFWPGCPRISLAITFWLWGCRAAPGPIAKALQIDFGSRRYVGMRLPMLAIHAWRRGLIGASRAAALCELDLVEYQQLVRDIGEEPEPSADTTLLGAAAVG